MNVTGYKHKVKEIERDYCRVDHTNKLIRKMQKIVGNIIDLYKSNHYVNTEGFF